FIAGKNITDNIIVAQEVMWNGVPTQKFCPTKRVRQICPLLLCLFILCIECLGHCIKFNINSRQL
ncbi:hypothetical protein J1N35_022993, partial [Gossypium stocksii]